MTTDEPPTPTTLEEAEQLRQELTLDVQSIQAQLGDRQRTDDDGNRLSTADYWQWKKKAQHALNQKLGHLREVKAWIREQRNSSYPSVREAVGHVESLCSLVEALSSYGELSFENSEQKQIDAAKDFLSRAKAITAKQETRNNDDNHDHDHQA
jgi:hypothetical protein